jgi:hypothetical protein
MEKNVALLVTEVTQITFFNNIDYNLAIKVRITVVLKYK